MRRRNEKRRDAADRAARKSAARARRRCEALRLAWAAEMCSTCAYRPGTEASREEGDSGLTTAREALLAAYLPFYCHEDPPPGAAPGRKLCVGHARRLIRMHRDGYEPPPDARERAVAAVRRLDGRRAVTDLLEEIEYR